MRLFLAALAAGLSAGAVEPARAVTTLLVISENYDELGGSGGSFLYIQNVYSVILQNVYITDPSPLVALFAANPGFYGSVNMFPFGDFYIGDSGPSDGAGGYKNLAAGSQVTVFSTSDAEDSGYYPDNNLPLTVTLDYAGQHYSVSFSPNLNDTGGFVPIYGDPDSSSIVQVAHIDLIAEPASMTLLGVGAGGIGLTRHRAWTASRRRRITPGGAAGQL